MASFQNDPSVSIFDVLTSSPSVAPPPVQISYHGQLWNKVDRTENRKKGTRVSMVWSLGQAYAAVDNPSKRVWRCGPCGGSNTIIALSADNTSNVGKHLASKHNIQLTEKST